MPPSPDVRYILISINNVKTTRAAEITTIQG